MEETLYLLNSHVNAQQLKNAIKDLKNGKNLVEVNIIFRSAIKRLRFIPKNSNNELLKD